ncbi:810_t:CDS:2 [Cetraspora pellucida]|uniref:810_t:CDS:1 n=1 Tax=Cetraspora pellucida TaxID=1433469 RepID=A0A9N9ALB7_9GLOM|nr:810_t:CDS:2 [Cetraspora pellucida]
MYPRQQIDNNFLNIPSIVTSPSIPTSASESFLFNFQQEPLTSPISQAISAPVTPTNSVTPGFPSHPPRRKGNQNNSTSNDGKINGSKSNSNLAHIPCKFFKSGACTAGKNCVFSHSKDPSADNYVCKYFLKGNCKYGNRCALSHNLPNGSSKINGRSSKNGSNVNGSRNGISNNSIPEIRSPIMHPQYSQDDYQPLNSPGIPFTRIPISPSEYHNNKTFSQLTASLSLNDQHHFSDETHATHRLRNNYSNDHLSAPVNINGQQRRSLPDIFHLNPVNAADSFGTSPFQPAGSKSIFLPVSYVSDSGLLSPTINPHQQLHSIPEIHDYSHHNEPIGDELCGYDFEEYIPSSLNELLTPTERERRKSKQEEASESTSRRLFSGSSTLHPHIDGPSLYNSHADPSHVHFAARSLPYGVSVGLASNYMNQNDGHQLGPGYNGQHLFNLNNSGQGMRNPISINTNFEDWNESISVRSPLSPANSMHNQFLSPTYERQCTPAINIPHPHEIHSSDQNQIYNHRVPVGIIGSRPSVHDQATSSPPDPFSPFVVNDDEIILFSMDNDKNEQLQEVSSSKVPETLKTPLSYSEATKVNLKDSGATPGLSIDSRRYEPLCPFGMAGNCRYGERCQSLHGLQCPSCLKLVLHPHLTPEEHQVHINECFSKQIQVTDGIRPEDIECGICFEKVLLKDDARFGLLNCEHAFCLQCIRQWRSSSNYNQNNQVIRACPICRTPSHFITPSTTWITDHEEKQRIINEYKRKCSNIPCKHFNYGDGQCQFGSSCFYSHVNRDGTKGEINIRTIRNGEEVKVLDNVRLWDFMESFADKRNSSVVGVTATIS